MRFDQDTLKIELYWDPVEGPESRRISKLLREKIVPKYQGIWFAEFEYNESDWDFYPLGNPHDLSFRPSIAFMRGSKTRLVDGADGITEKQIHDILKDEFGMSGHVSGSVDVDREKKVNWPVIIVSGVIAVALAVYVFKK